jgi:Domain of unknown function (DUF1844)
MNAPSPPSRDSLLFLQLVLGFQQSGMMALGKLTNPITHKIEVQLGVARDTIDTLAMIEARTQGRLDADEARILRQALTDLRLNYVEELKKSNAPATPQES